MSDSVERLKGELASLPLQERADLAHFLIENLNQEPEADVEAAWDARLERRIAEIKSGQAVGKPADQVFAELRREEIEKAMHNEFTAIIEQDEDWYVAYCPEVPGANGQGRTKDEVIQSLSEAIALILQDRREKALRGVPAEAIREVVRVG